jgi:hypothetical protein
LGDTFDAEKSSKLLNLHSQLIRKLSPVYPDPPTPTRPNEFFRRDMAGEPHIKDSDVDWIAFWNAKIRQARAVNHGEFEEAIEETIGAGEEMVQTLNGGVLARLRELIEEDLRNESTGFDRLFCVLFGSPLGREKPEVSFAEAEYFYIRSPIKDVMVMNLFAWQVPHLTPRLTSRARFLGGAYWTLLALGWLTRWSDKAERNECRRKDQDPWVLMSQYAALLRP